MEITKRYPATTVQMVRNDCLGYITPDEEEKAVRDGLITFKDNAWYFKMGPALYGYAAKALEAVNRRKEESEALEALARDFGGSIQD